MTWRAPPRFSSAGVQLRHRRRSPDRRGRDCGSPRRSLDTLDVSTKKGPEPEALSLESFFYWSGREDSNLRPLGPEPTKYLENWPKLPEYPRNHAQIMLNWFA
jgi:hypothetical protein